MLHILRPLNLPKSNAPSCPGNIIESSCSTENVPRGPPPPPLSPACRPTNCPEVTEVVPPPPPQMLDLGRAAVGSPPGCPRSSGHGALCLPPLLSGPVTRCPAPGPSPCFPRSPEVLAVRAPPRPDLSLWAAPSGCAGAGRHCAPGRLSGLSPKRLSPGPACDQPWTGRAHHSACQHQFGPCSGPREAPCLHPSEGTAPWLPCAALGRGGEQGRSSGRTPRGGGWGGGRNGMS